MADGQRDDVGTVFTFFNEIGILQQLSRAKLEAVLPDGLLSSHFTVLNHLIRVGDGATPHKLARAFHIPKTTMTHTLAGLDKRGLIEMRPNPKDARSKEVWLTEPGRLLREETIAKLGPAFLPLLEVVSPDRMAQVLPILQEVRKFLDAERD